MKTSLPIKTQRQAALISGIAIITMTIAATIANDGTLGRLIVESNATETVRNIQASRFTFNLGILSWLVILISDVFAAWGLYLFFKSANQNLSLITAWFRLVYAAMLAASIFNLVYTHLLIHQPGISGAGDAGQLSANVMFYLNAFDRMFSVSLIVFGIHILLLGLLCLKSMVVPKIFGIVLLIAFAGYAIINISKLLFPEYNDAIRIVEWIFLFPMLGEVALGIWLLIIGLRK